MNRRLLALAAATLTGAALCVAVGVQASAAPAADPDFGPNVLVFDPSMSAEEIQGRLNSVFDQQETNQFGDERYAIR